MSINFSLVTAAAMIGLTGGVHCVAMCGAAATLATPRGSLLAYQAGRVTGYAVMGAVAALGAAGFGQVATHAAWARPLWLMSHVALMFLGIWMLTTGRHPAWMQQGLLELARGAMSRLGTGSSALFASQTAMAGSGAGSGTGGVEIRLPARIARQRGPAARTLRTFATGMAWALLPCGLLYSALMLAWMSGDVATGSLSMAAFAVVSGVQLMLGQRGLAALLRMGRETLAVRLAGAVTMAGAGLLLVWAAMGHAPEGFCLPGF